MKRKVMVAILAAALIAFGAIAVFALDNNGQEEPTTVTALFQIDNPYEADDEFEMVSDCGEITIKVTAETPVYFEGYVPLGDDDEGYTKNAREVLFGRTLAEVLNNRDLVVEFDGDEVVSITILFVTAVHLPIEVYGELEDDEYVGIVWGPEVIDWDYLGEINHGDENSYIGFETLPYYFGDDFDFEWECEEPAINGELLVDYVIIEGAPAPFWQETEYCGVVMVPLRAVATALGYDLSWNGYLQSIQMGAAIHIWIGETEMHFGRMAPLELSAAPVLLGEGVTFVPLDFFRLLGYTAYLFEGQVVIATESDMM